MAAASGCTIKTMRKRQIYQRNQSYNYVHTICPSISMAIREHMFMILLFLSFLFSPTPTECSLREDYVGMSPLLFRVLSHFRSLAARSKRVG